MSLLPTANKPNDAANMDYFLRNSAANPLFPRVATNGSGVLQIEQGVGGVANIYTGVAGAGTLKLGSDAASFQNIVLTSGLTSINTSVLMTEPGSTLVVESDVTVGGDLVLADGANGGSISGYYSANVPVVGAGAVPNPAGLTNGVYLAVYIGNGAGNENAQPSGVFYYTTVGGWSGNAVSFNFTAGAPNVALGPVAGGATLNIGGASVPATGTVYIRKLMN